MNPTTFGFRPGTPGDFQAFAGAASDALFLSLQSPGNDEASAVAIYAESERSLHVYLCGMPFGPMDTYWTRFDGGHAKAMLFGVRDYMIAALGTTEFHQAKALGFDNA